MSRKYRGVTFLIGLVCTSVCHGLPARASDGAIEINMAAATAGGVTPGDGSGFPVTIDQPGSYVLTGNLQVDEDATAIQITADNVTLDLNGFSILGPTSCTGSPPTCTATGTGIGVFSIGINVTVRNGTVRGMGASGIELLHDSRVVEVYVRSNGSAGINTGDSSEVRRCMALLNGDDGIRTSVGMIIGNHARINAGDGIEAASGSTVLDNVATQNGAFGLNLGSTAGYGGNVLTFNNGGNLSPQVSGGLELGDNVCGTNTTCP